MLYKQKLSVLLHDLTGIDEKEIYNGIEVPPQPEMGDLAFPCFRLAKKLKKAPQAIAQDLYGKLKDRPQWLQEVAIKGGYLNFFYNKEVYARTVLDSFRNPTFRPGKDKLEGEGKTVLVEYSSPNIAKPFHVGHAFTTLLGEAIANLYAYRGYDVKRLNHLGDYGTQFGKLIVAWQLWGSEEALKEDAITELQRVYVKFYDELSERPELEDMGREAFRLLEENSPEERALWERFRSESLIVFERLYRRLGIQFDSMNGESFYSDKIPAVVEMLREKDLLVMSEGAQVVNLDAYNLNPCLILKSDGATIYATRDLAAVYYRDKTWNFDKNIYVVGLPQNNHFQQVFAVLREAGFPKVDDCVHVGFGTVKFADRAFSTRKGNVILLEDLLNESVAKTRKIIEQNNPDMSEQEIAAIAESVGVGAVKYTFLRNGRERDIVFSWDEILDFEGDTAPYLQYSYARCSSILRLAEENYKAISEPALLFDGIDYGLLVSDDELAILKLIDGFEDQIVEALTAHEPSIMLRRISQLARAFNRFYHNHSILKAESTEHSRARLGLTVAVRKTLASGLGLAGIDVLERM